MDERDVLKAEFQKLNPCNEQKEKIWNHLEKKEIVHKKVYVHKGLITAVIVMCVMTGVGVDMATGGNAIAAIQNIFRRQDEKDKKSKEIVNQVIRIQEKDSRFAPDIFYLSEKHIIFGTIRGLVIYDRKNAQVLGTVDLQEIDCYYFNGFGGKRKTRVLVKDDKLIIYNAIDNQLKGEYYIFLLEQDRQQLLSEKRNNLKSLKKINKQWEKEQEEKYRMTSEVFQESLFLREEIIKKEWEDSGRMSLYSESSIEWKGNNGEELFSCLRVDKDGQFIIHTKNIITKKEEQEKLNLKSEPMEKDIKLPSFVYHGNDKIENAIFEKYYGEMQVEGTLIPMPTIVEKVIKGNEIKVFGIFRYGVYTKTGKVLEEVSSGSLIGCIILKKVDGNYQIKKIEQPRDGALLYEDLKKITEGYPSVYKKMEKLVRISNQKKAKKKWMKYYIQSTELELEYKIE